MLCLYKIASTEVTPMYTVMHFPFLSQLATIYIHKIRIIINLEASCTYIEIYGYYS